MGRECCNYIARTSKSPLCGIERGERASETFATKKTGIARSVDLTWSTHAYNLIELASEQASDRGRESEIFDAYESWPRSADG